MRAYGPGLCVEYVRRPKPAGMAGYNEVSAKVRASWTKTPSPAHNERSFHQKSISMLAIESTRSCLKNKHNAKAPTRSRLSVYFSSLALTEQNLFKVISPEIPSYVHQRSHDAVANWASRHSSSTTYATHFILNERTNAARRTRQAYSSGVFVSHVRRCDASAQFYMYVRTVG